MQSVNQKAIGVVIEDYKVRYHGEAPPEGAPKYILVKLLNL